MARRYSWVGALIVVLAAATATAQTARIQPPPVPTMWQHGSTLNLFAGATSDSSTRGTIGGGAVGWELTPRFAVEGSGEWTEWGAGSHGFASAITTQMGLAGPRPLMPFVTAGVGLYRASFDQLAPMPGFYSRRMTSDGMGMGTRASFTDPTVVLGGGVNAFLSRHWAIRPDVQEIIVIRDSRKYLVSTFAVHLAYHFEEHPITPNVR